MYRSSGPAAVRARNQMRVNFPDTWFKSSTAHDFSNVCLAVRARMRAKRGAQQLLRLGLALTVQDRVHGGRAGLDDRSELMAVYGLRDDRRAVADQVGDLVDGDVVVAHDRDEGVT